MAQSADRRTDIGVALAIIVICAIVLYETRDLPAGTFEPLGSAPIPQAVATIIILLSSLVIASAARRPPSDATSEPSSYLHAGVTVLLTIIFVALIHMRIATFAVLTTGYLILTIGWLVQFKPKLLPAVIATATITGFGCQYVFTRIFVVDLPGL